MPFSNAPTSFAIEVPAEANPLSPQTLFHTLIGASSSDRQQVQTGAQQLQNWEKQSGFYSGLQTIFIDTSLPVDVRYLAAIHLKNGIPKYWRKTAQNAISKEEKTLVRSRSIEIGINEADHRLALQNAIVIATIVRLEFPHDWPDAITSVTHHLRISSQPAANPIHLPRTLLILLYIVKELSTAKLLRSQLSLRSAAPEVFQVLAKVYIDKVNSWMRFIQSGGDNEGGAISDIEHSLLALRVVRRLVISGYEHPNRHSEIQEFWGIIRTQFGEMLSLVSQHGGSLHPLVRSQIEKHLIQISKLHLEMVKVHPSSFPFLPDSIGLAKAYWGLLVEFGQTFGSQTADTSVRIGTDGDADDDDVPCMEKLSLKGLRLLRACVKMVYNPAHTFKYQNTQDKEERKQSTNIMKTGLLPEALVREMMEVLVTRFFVFRPRDLREWEEEPGEWERREEGEGEVWEFSIRSCAEKLFLDLVINNKDLLIQPLLNVFYTVATPQNTDILLKDSIYAAIGLAAPVLESHLDFETFLELTLIPEIQVQQRGYNILRRRIAIVLGQWLVVKNGMNRSLVYQIIQYLLNKEEKLNDQVVRVTAGRQLKNIVDPFEFTAEPFMPFAPIILGRIMALVEEVDLSETKMALLSTISTLVVRLEHHINPFADQIISLLPPLWEQAGDEYLMKQSILAILSALVTSMKDESRRYHPMILPLIQSSVEPESPTRPYLLEDAMDLWGAVLVQSAESSEDILNLTQYLFPLFETGDEPLRKSLELTESYFLLAPQAMLQNSTRFLASFADLLAAGLKREANGIITHLVEILIQAANQLGGAAAVETLTKVLLDTKFLVHLFAGLKSAHDSHQSTGPHRSHTDVDGIVETDYLSVLARILLASPIAFINAISTIFPSVEVAINWLLTEWFSHFENIGSPDKKKLMCLALTSLLELGPQNWVLGRLQDLMGVWTDVVTECMEYPEDGGEGKDTLVYWDPDGLKGEEPEAPEETRRRNSKILFADPVHRINIKLFIGEHLQQAIVACGGQEIFQRDWLTNVDADVIRSFGSLRIL